jgi:hypothetical protein
MRSAIVRAIVAAALIGSAAASQAQTTSTATQTKTFEVLAVDGNLLVVRLPEGTRELKVADDFRFTVDGQQLSVQQLKPGMRGSASITTRTTVTPVTVTEIKNGTVAMQTGSSIIVRTDEGLKSFTQGDIDKRGVKIIREGKPAQVSDFRQGDRLSATIITSLPPKVVTEKEVQATLAASGGTGSGASGSARSASAANSSASSSGASGGGSSSGGTRTLPKTASRWPLLGFVSALSLAMGLALTLRRRLI